jgi:hypothetical protein
MVTLDYARIGVLILLHVAVLVLHRLSVHLFTRPYNRSLLEMLLLSKIPYMPLGQESPKAIYLPVLMPMSLPIPMPIPLYFPSPCIVDDTAA